MMTGILRRRSKSYLGICESKFAPVFFTDPPGWCVKMRGLCREFLLKYKPGNIVETFQMVLKLRKELYRRVYFQIPGNPVFLAKITKRCSKQGFFEWYSESPLSQLALIHLDTSSILFIILLGVCGKHGRYVSWHEIMKLGFVQY